MPSVLSDWIAVSLVLHNIVFVLQNTVFLIAEITSFPKKSVLLVSQITVFLMSQNIVGIPMEDGYCT